MKRLGLIMLVLGFTLTTPTKAVDENGFYEYVGDVSCGGWILERRAVINEFVNSRNYTNMLTIEGWISGYLTAYNAQTPGVYDIQGDTDMESISLWMDNYCLEHPLNKPAQGMEILTETLWPRRTINQPDAR
jgi:hypothetical protein